MATDKKIKTVQNLQDFATTLANAWSKAENITEVFFDRGFSGAITDEEILTATGVTADQVTTGITLAQSLILFLKNGTVTPGDRLAVINQLRTDI
jgi:hypothetical protein